MSLRDIHSGRKAGSNAHGEGVALFRKTVGNEAFGQIEEWLMSLFDQQEWVNTTFVAPTTWTGTPLQPIWDYFPGIKDDQERHRESAIMYGCVVYTILHQRPETYLFHRPEGHHSSDARPFGLTYRRE